ncbi:MAG: ABC transporter permease [Deltaproteobacteria bacterium]|nr:ABC transporter permease [Deltaproteobacteria bacterium]
MTARRPAATNRPMRAYAIRIAVRYLLAKKKAFVSFITVMAVVGVAIGVAALTTIIGASSGLQGAITDKVVGVNSHVLVMTGGWEFDRYEDVVRLSQSIPGVAGAAPFVINERMLLKGARTHGILVKGVEPERSGLVLDVARQITRGDGRPGSLEDLRPSANAERRLAERTADGSAASHSSGDPFDVWEGLDTGELPLPGPGAAEDGRPPPTPAPTEPASEDDPPASPAPEATRRPAASPPVPPAFRSLLLAALPGRLPAEDDAGHDAEAVSEAGGAEAAPPLPELATVAPPGSGRVASGGRTSEDLFHDSAYDPSLFDAPRDEPDPLTHILEQQGNDVVGTTGDAAALPTIVVGRTLAENLGIEVGDVVKIVSPSGSLGFGFGAHSGPSDVAFQVAGIFYSGFNEYDSRMVYIHLHEAQAMFQRGDTVTGVELRLDDLERADAVADELRGLLAAYDTIEGLQGVRGGFLRSGAAWDRFPSRRWLPRRTAALAVLPATLLADATHQAAYRVITWKELNKNLFTALWIQKVVLTIVLAVVVGVAAFNIVSTLIMIVLEKKKEIAILKSMGSPDGDVRTVFVTVGTVIGLVGLSIGLALGYGISAALRAYAWPLDPKVYMIDHLPVDVRLFDYVACAAIAFGICLIATLIPSWRASRMRPVEGLHYE